MARLILAVVALSALFAPTVRAQNDEPNRAAIVVDTSEMCVFFEEPTITGIELLQRSNLDVEIDTQGQGQAVCKIDGTGCDRGDCFCDFPTFWGYWNRDGDEWEFAQVGAADREVKDDSVDGWVYGKDGKPAPPDTTFDDVCGAATPRALPSIDTVREPTDSPPPSIPVILPFLTFLGGASYLLIRRRRTRR